MMTKFIAYTALFFVLTVTNAQAQEDEMAKRMELAKEYSKVVPVSTDIANAIDEMVTQVPVDQRPLFRSILERSIKAERVETSSELALAETFTAAELEKLIEFYSTPEGKSIKTKMPEYQSRLQPILQGMVVEAVQSLQAQTE